MGTIITTILRLILLIWPTHHETPPTTPAVQAPAVATTTTTTQPPSVVPQTKLALVRPAATTTTTDASAAVWVWYPSQQYCGQTSAYNAAVDHLTVIPADSCVNSTYIGVRRPVTPPVTTPPIEIPQTDLYFGCANGVTVDLTLGQRCP